MIVEVWLKLSRMEFCYSSLFHQYHKSEILYVPGSSYSKFTGSSSTANKSRWHRFLRRWVPIPVGVGLTVFAVLQWRKYRDRTEQQIRVAKDWEIKCYRAVPCRALSRAWGWVSDRNVPEYLRSWVYGQYSSVFSVNLDEMVGNFTDYNSLAQFFTRRLKDGVRPVDATTCMVSPADGRVVTVSEVNSCKVEQVKGVTYSIQTFLGDPTWRIVSNSYITDSPKVDLIENLVNERRKLKDENENELSIKEISGKMETKKSSTEMLSIHPISAFFWGGYDFVRYLLSPGSAKFDTECKSMDWEDYRKHLLHNPKNKLYQVTVYLAPGDYHRFHSPVHWNVNFRRHFQGELLSVNPRIASWIPDLFCLNERAVYVGNWEHGFFSMVAVGATNVGSIRVHSDESLHTNTRKWRDGKRHRDRHMNINWHKGEEIGEFRMGSTIVLLFEAPENFQFNVSPGQKIRVGESVCCMEPRENVRKKETKGE